MDGVALSYFHFERSEKSCLDTAQLPRTIRFLTSFEMTMCCPSCSKPRPNLTPPAFMTKGRAICLRLYFTLSMFISLCQYTRGE